MAVRLEDLNLIWSRSASDTAAKIAPKMTLHALSGQARTVSVSKRQPTDPQLVWYRCNPFPLFSFVMNRILDLHLAVLIHTITTCRTAPKDNMPFVTTKDKVDLAVELREMGEPDVLPGRPWVSMHCL